MMKLFPKLVAFGHEVLLVSVSVQPPVGDVQDITVS